MSWTIVYRHFKLICRLWWRKIKKKLGHDDLKALEKWYENEYINKPEQIELSLSNEEQHVDWKPPTCIPQHDVTTMPIDYMLHQVQSLWRKTKTKEEHKPKHEDENNNAPHKEWID